MKICREGPKTGTNGECCYQGPATWQNTAEEEISRNTPQRDMRRSYSNQIASRSIDIRSQLKHVEQMFIAHACVELVINDA